MSSCLRLFILSVWLLKLLPIFNTVVLMSNVRRSALLCSVLQNMGRTADWDQISFSLCKVLKRFVFFSLVRAPQSSPAHCQHKTMSTVASPAHSLRMLERIRFLICPEVSPGIDCRSRRRTLTPTLAMKTLITSGNSFTTW